MRLILLALDRQHQLRTQEKVYNVGFQMHYLALKSTHVLRRKESSEISGVLEECRVDNDGLAISIEDLSGHSRITAGVEEVDYDNLDDDSEDLDMDAYDGRNEEDLAGERV